MSRRYVGAVAPLLALLLAGRAGGGPADVRDGVEAVTAAANASDADGLREAVDDLLAVLNRQVSSGELSSPEAARIAAAARQVRDSAALVAEDAIDAEREAQEEAARERAEAERKAQEEADRKAREEADRQAEEDARQAEDARKAAEELQKAEEEARKKAEQEVKEDEKQDEGKDGGEGGDG